MEAGGVELTETTWKRMADDCGVSKRLIDPIREAYIAPSNHLFPMLQPVGNDRFTLAPAYTRELDLL